MKLLIVLSIMLVGCATPTRTAVYTEFYESGAPRVERTIAESGWQLFVGERHDALTSGTVTSDIGKRTLGVVAGALGGAAIGAAVGNPEAGAVVGTVAGGIGEAVSK